MELSDDLNVMDLNVLVVGGKVDDRNVLATLIGSTLMGQGFADVKLATTGPVVVVHPEGNMLEALQTAMPALFTQPVHVTAAAMHQAFIMEGELLDEDHGGNMMMTFIPVHQPVSMVEEPPTPEEIAADQKSRERMAEFIKENQIAVEKEQRQRFVAEQKAELVAVLDTADPTAILDFIDDRLGTALTAIGKVTSVEFKDGLRVFRL